MATATTKTTMALPLLPAASAVNSNGEDADGRFPVEGEHGGGGGGAGPSANGIRIRSVESSGRLSRKSQMSVQIWRRDRKE